MNELNLLSRPEMADSVLSSIDFAHRLSVLLLVPFDYRA